MDIKQGSGEKVVSKNKNASLDRFLERGKDILAAGVDTPPTTVEEADPLVTSEMAAADGPPPQEDGGRRNDVVEVAALEKQVTGSQTEQRESMQSVMILPQVDMGNQQEPLSGNGDWPCPPGISLLKQWPAILRDNETTQGDKFFSLSDHSSWSSNEQLDLEADKTSSELDSEVSSLALGRESHESSKNATVRKKTKKRSEQVGPNKHSINPLDTKGPQGLQWEYSKDDLTLHDNGEKQPNPVSLETIYQSIMEHREESKLESRRTQVACRKMQIQIRQVAKTCSEFTTRMEEAETRISHLEDEAGSYQLSREVMEKQLEDTQWKLTDLEDRLRRNNLRVLGVPEGLEGSDTHSFMVALFKEAFPDLQQWDWDREIQRAHRFPFSKIGPNSEGGSGRPRVILIYLLNYQARQAIYDRARPNSRSKAKGCEFFVRPDFCHSTVEKRWRLRQLIQPLQSKGVQAFLLNPAKLKVVTDNRTHYFSSEVKARAFLDGLNGPVL
ncbi:hypothetical protein NDU88_006687 [Pleurodeles waltl]|uniref:Uncharacterized protein n=1 Tax=Pleurodeles waltl TaxID=8319 RepID=A0AAV7X1T0_PLEWA|nr:hypothetical protein NDU88_006687 [Pleurodeles waltl]